MQIAKGLGQNIKLRGLNIGGNLITSKGVYEICEALKINTNLLKIHFSIFFLYYKQNKKCIIRLMKMDGNL